MSVSVADVDANVEVAPVDVLTLVIVVLPAVYKNPSGPMTARVADSDDTSVVVSPVASEILRMRFDEQSPDTA